MRVHGGRCVIAGRSLIAAAWIVFASACGQPAAQSSGISSPPSTAPVDSATARETPVVAGNAEGRHEHRAPHGGTLVELGKEFAHVELVLDPGTGTLTAYALDGEAENAVRLTQSQIIIWFVPPGRLPIEAALAGVSNPLTGETATDTSQYRATVTLLRGVATFEGSIKNVVVRERPFRDVAFRYPSDGHE